jgi:malate permease and related proteins
MQRTIAASYGLQVFHMHIVESVLTILILIGVGAAFARKMKLNEENSAVLSKIVVIIALPAYMIHNLTSNYDKPTLVSMAPGLLIPFASMGICILLSILFARIFSIPEKRRGVFESMFSLSNSIFIGLPVNLMLFGDVSVPYVLLYYIANTTLFWTFAVYTISRDGHDGTFHVFSTANLKRVFSPPLTAFLLAVVLILLNITLPKLAIDTCKIMGSMTTPVSMIFIGIVLHSVNWKTIRPNRDLFLIIAARFVIAPFIIILLCRFVPLPLLMKKVFVIQASMPVMTQTSIIARAYHADYKYAAVITSVTTVASLITIPLYMFIMNNFNIF